VSDSSQTQGAENVEATPATDSAPADLAHDGPVDPASQAWEPPAARPSGTTAVAGPLVSFGFNLEKIAGQGEDSDPIVRHGRGLGLVAVFDGMGGAGGTVYETPDGPHTGAYLASRLARDVVEQRSTANRSTSLSGHTTT
jgi:hypothetical protein